MHLADRPAAQVAHQLRLTCGPALPIVATSAAQKRSKAALLGACAFVQKPFELDELLAVVYKTLRSSGNVRVRGKALRDEPDRLLLLQAKVTRRSRPIDPRERKATDVLGEAVRTTGARGGSLVAAASGYTLETVATNGFGEDLVDLWTRFPADSHVPLAHASSGEPIWLRSIEEGCNRYPEMLGTLSTTRWARALCAVPAGYGRTSVGALGLVFDSPQEFDRGARDRIAALAEDAALVLTTD
jgi:CheY-like chemotaxis protein